MDNIFEKINLDWKLILQTMKEDFEISDHIYSTFIEGILTPTSYKDTVLYIEVPEEGYINFLNKRILSELKVSIAHFINIPVDNFSIIFTTKNSTFYQNHQEEDFNTKLRASGIMEPTNTFDNFVQGSSNALAYATCIAISENPGSDYNPLFLYSMTGLGKTHLMHAIANAVMRKNPEYNVIFTTCENFFNEFYQSIQHNKQQEFKNKYRNVDMLLIDDIQFLSKKPETQEEFFNTFNALRDNKKQIVVTSDRPIKELQDIEDRILSRLSWGSSCDIQRPDYETRLAILRKKEEIIEPLYPVDNEVMKYIAMNVKSNIRELELALKNIILYSKLLNKPIDIELAKDRLSDIKQKEEKKITPEKIIRIVCEHFGVNPLDVCGPRRNREYVYARDIAIFLCREQITDITQEKIGSFFGGRDHATVINSCTKIEKRIKNDKDLEENLNVLREKLCI